MQDDDNVSIASLVPGFFSDAVGSGGPRSVVVRQRQRLRDLPHGSVLILRLRPWLTRTRRVMGIVTGLGR